MWAPAFQFLFCATVIAVAGSFLTKFSESISTLSGWKKMLVGGILLAGATSLPELIVDLKSVSLGLPDLAAGDLLGSCLFNILILSILDFTFPSSFRSTSFSSLNFHHSLSAMLAIFLTSIVGLGIVSSMTSLFMGASLFSWAIMIVYFFGMRLIYRNENNHLGNSERSVSSKLKKLMMNRSFVSSSVGYILSAITIFVTAPYLVKSADEISKLSGLSHTFIGTTLVALSTSLPELVSTFTAFRMNEPDLAIGNIFGSNIFNILMFFPLDLYYRGGIFNAISEIHLISVFCIILSMSVAVMGQIYRKECRSRFSEPSSEIVAIIVLFSLFLIGLG
jgi:cation:H+ antiporter